METSHHSASAPEFNVAMLSFHFICKKFAEVKEKKKKQEQKHDLDIFYEQNN